MASGGYLEMFHKVDLFNMPLVRRLNKFVRVNPGGPIIPE